ncbi:MAG: hypothetical protein IJR89_05970 [Clostridia bacterium]|nr:hypothetical protein [Clostridia bacterium]
MKNRLIPALFLVFAMVVSLFAALPVSAAEKGTVVYVKDGGKGDGSSPDQAVEDLFDAYDALDLSKDCTVVVCGVFTQEFTFSYGEEYVGSVTFTSLYGGVDYRQSGAVYQANPEPACRFVCWGETTFEQINFKALQNNIMIVGQHHPITIGEGVDISGPAGLTGGSIAKAFTVMGGYQNDQDDPPLTSDKDTSITVLSGSKIYILPFSRNILGTYSGTAYVRVGGNADVTVLHGSSAYPNGIELGNVKMWIYGNAHIKNFYGCTQDTTWDSFEFNWISGTIDLFEWVCSYTPNKSTLFKNGTTLYTTNLTKADPMYETIKSFFEDLKDSDGQVPDIKIAKPDVTPKTDPVETEAPETQAPETNAPETKATETTEATGTKSTDTEAPGTKATETKAVDPAVTTAPAAQTEPTGGVPVYVWILIAVAIVAAGVVAFILIKKKQA